ncbi:MAG TPA: hypothetical protein VIK18_08350 [Pirellulales bacterium]
MKGELKIELMWTANYGDVPRSLADLKAVRCFAFRERAAKPRKNRWLGLEFKIRADSQQWRPLKYLEDRGERLTAIFIRGLCFKHQPVWAHIPSNLRSIDAEAKSRPVEIGLHPQLTVFFEKPNFRQPVWLDNVNIKGANGDRGGTFELKAHATSISDRLQRRSSAADALRPAWLRKCRWLDTEIVA